MKTYGVGLHRIGVYETGDARPPDAVAAVAHEAAIFFVDRVAGMSGLVDAGAMTEAVARHCRLKIAAPADFELHFNDRRANAAPHLADRLRAWREQRQDGLTKHLHDVFWSSAKAKAESGPDKRSMT